MRKHGWQLPYHPLQVVAVGVFLALGFGFYVFFAPFVGKKMLQYIAIGIYTPLITCAFGLYILCAATDPADPGVFRSKKYLKIPDVEKNSSQNNSKLPGESTSSIHDANASTAGGRSLDKEIVVAEATLKDLGCEIDERKESSRPSSCFLLAVSPCMLFCKSCGSNEESSEQQMSEEGMFYCSLCEVEVFKYSKHCRVCDKCVDRFDHHCRWLNNCIGKRNYRKFFALMVSALLLLILQWSTGILVLACCFLDRKRFSSDIPSKLGSSFSLVPYVIVVALCTILAMVATLPIAQLFFFHILLVKKGISTYDYIIALREQEQEQQEGGGQHSQQMSPASSITGLSSASSFTTFRRGALCTPPRLFLEDQFDVVPPDTGSVSSYGKRSSREEPNKKKTPAPVKISPWTLARLNAEEVSRAAAEARKRSKILQPVARQGASLGLETESLGSSRRTVPRPDNNRKRIAKRVRLPADLPSLEPANTTSSLAAMKGFPTSSTSLGPLQLEARTAFQTSRAMSSSGEMVVASSPESSIESPDIHPLGVSLSETDESRRLTGIPVNGGASQPGIPLSRSTSDGYEASGGEDSDRVPSRLIQRSTDWSSLLLHSEQDDGITRLKAAAASSSHNRMF